MERKEIHEAPTNPILTDGSKNRILL